MTVLDRPPLPAPPARPGRRLPAPAVVTVAAAGLVGVLAVALAVGGGPGSLVEWAVPVSRLAARLAALGVIGTLLFAAALHPRTTPASPAVDRALRATSLWATAWAAATAVHALLTLTLLVGPSPTASEAWIFLADLPAGRSALVVVAVAVLVAGAARRCTTPRRAGSLLAVTTVGVVVPAVLTGHSSAAEDHVVAVTNLSLHVVAASLWVGGLLALLVHGRGTETLAPAATRFSAVALGCFVATGLSGLLAAWSVVGGTADGVSAALGTGYGWLLVAKTAALGALGVFGWQHRRRSLSRLRAGRPGSFRSFAGAEVAVMLATVALAVGLSASPPPSTAAASASERAASSTQQTADDRAGPTAALPAEADPMAGHDHGELSVGVLIDESRFHVSGPVEAGSLVTLHNATATEVTITASDGSFDLVVPGNALMTFRAPEAPGSYPFTSRHSASFSDVLVVE